MKDHWRGFQLFLQRMHPVRLVTLGYLSYVAAGWLFLSLPIFHQQSGVSSLDALFTAASAMSTTGLVTVSTGNNFNLGGQIIILLLIQMGGIGYMTFGSFVALTHSDTLSERRKTVGETVFILPQGFRIDKFVRSVIVFTLIIEVAGAAALYAAFSDVAMPHRLWSSIFHSVSAFCTAGFSLYDTSFEQFQGHFWINCVLTVLSYLGAIGFIVFIDAWRMLIGKSQRLTLTSRVILVTTLWISVAAAALFFVGEPAIRALPLHERMMAACFQVMASITTVGFNTIPIGGLSQASLFLIILLMVIGASPSGTGGGLKTTTFTALFSVLRAALKGQRKPLFWGRAIPEERVWTAVANVGFYMAALIAGCYLLSLTETFPFESILFESASALGTVGLSTGITVQLSPLGKLIITALMFVGRLGPLAFGVAIFLSRPTANDPGTDDLAV